jgi:Helicase associated domain
MDASLAGGHLADSTNTCSDADEDDKKPPAMVYGAAPRKRKRYGSKPEKTNHQERWQMMFDRLVAYKQKQGDTNVPNRYPKDPQVCEGNGMSTIPRLMSGLV